MGRSRTSGKGSRSHSDELANSSTFSTESAATAVSAASMSTAISMASTSAASTASTSSTSSHVSFEELPLTTRTLIVYANGTFNLDKLYRNLTVTVNDTTGCLKKRKKQMVIDKKKIRAKAGEIVYLQYRDTLRGLLLKKPKTYQCLRCSPPMYNEETGKVIKTPPTVHEHFYKIDINPTENEHGGSIRNAQPSSPRTSLGYPHEYASRYFCTKCQEYYKLTDLGKINTFLNQLTVAISIGEVIINVMIFETSMKVAGIQHASQPDRLIRILWEHILKVDGGFTLHTKRSHDSQPSVPRFIFNNVMSNYSCKLGYYVDRHKLNRLINDIGLSKYPSRFEPNSISSTFDPTSKSNVNIKIKSSSDKHTYKVLEFHPYVHSLSRAKRSHRRRHRRRIHDSQTEGVEGDDGVEGGESVENNEDVATTKRANVATLSTIPDYPLSGEWVVSYTDKCPEKSTRKPKRVSLITYVSGECILSGRYENEMREFYESLMHIFETYRSLIEERLITTDETLCEYLKKQFNIILFE